MNKKKKKIIISSVLSASLVLPTIIISSLLIVNVSEANKYMNDSLDDKRYFNLDRLIKKSYFPTISRWVYNKKISNQYSWSWYKTISNKNWLKNTTNFYCDTEGQAFSLYLCCLGDFWNIELHKGQEPTDKKHTMQSMYHGRVVDIRGADYKYISNALSRNSLIENTVAYHGVEFMEDEFYLQLKDYIKYDQLTKSYNYSDCVGKVIKSNGFISTTLHKEHATDFVDGYNWTNDTYHLPLKEKFAFKIYIPKNIKNVGYVSLLDFAGWTNYEEQILIDRNSRFNIKRYYKDGDINFFDLLYLGV